LAELAEVLDFINLMTYDMGTSFSAVSSFNAPLSEVAHDPLAQPMRRWNNRGARPTARQSGTVDTGVPGFRPAGSGTGAGRSFALSNAGEQGAVLIEP
jgi:chitinase